MEYCIIGANTIADLQSRVTVQLEMDWELAGGIAIDSQSDVRYLQAMVHFSSHPDYGE